MLAGVNIPLINQLSLIDGSPIKRPNVNILFPPNHLQYDQVSQPVATLLSVVTPKLGRTGGQNHLHDDTLMMCNEESIKQSNANMTARRLSFRLWSCTYGSISLLQRELTLLSPCNYRMFYI